MGHTEFIVRIAPGSARTFAVRVLKSPAGEGEGTFELPFTAQELELLGGGPDDLGSPEEALADELSPRDIGGRLFEALFSGQVGRLYERSLGEVAGGTLRLLLKIDPEVKSPALPNLCSLPWELLYRVETRDFLCLSRQSPVLRYLEVARPVRRAPLPSLLRILVLISSPSGWTPLDIERETRNLEEAWRGHETVEIVYLEQVTANALRETLLNGPFHVIHFIGHGDFDAQAGKGELVFETPEGMEEPISGEVLATQLKDFSSVRLVFLNACRTAATAGIDALAGVANALVLGGLPAVVAMQVPISDEAAIAFSDAFYRRLAAGEPVDLAVTEGRQAVYSLSSGESVEWAAPVLFTRVQGGEVFEVEDRRDTLRTLRRPPQKTYTARLPATGRELFGREGELALLDSAWSDLSIRILALVAWGGVGKTSLINHWLHRMQQESYRGAVRVYGWSFYSQGSAPNRQASADGFLDDALRWFGDTETVTASLWDRGIRLAELVAQQPTLLILDGLEPLQYPPGTLQGQLRDQGMQAFLKHLARCSHGGLCVITTRIPVADLEVFESLSVRQVELEHLSPEAGLQLLRHLGVEGEEDEISAAAMEFEGHALALTLLGRYLTVVYDGDVRKTELIPRITEEEEVGGHAKRVMSSYEEWLNGSKELGILYLMGLFDRPAEAAALATLHAEDIFDRLSMGSEFSSVTWKYAVAHLRGLRLLADAETADPETLDCHPLVREYFASRFKSKLPTLWVESHRRLYEYYRNVPTAYHPETLKELEPLFAAVPHGCEALSFQDTLEEVFKSRINRRKSYSTKELGAFGANLSALSGFFERLWDRPVVEFSTKQKLYVLNRAGLFLSAMGHVREAIGPTLRGLKMHLDQGSWLGASKCAANLKEFNLKLGRIDKVVEFARLSLEYADKSGEMSHRVRRRTTLANALHLQGLFVEAEALFLEAETMRREYKSGYLKSLSGFKFCSLLIDLRRYDEVQERLDRMAEGAKRKYKLSVVARIRFYAGLVLLAQAKSGIAIDLKKALALFDEAVEGLRASGRQDTLPYPLMERAALKRIQGDLQGAWVDLEEACEICEQREMKLNMVHIHLGKADLHSADGRLDQARSHLQTARDMIREMGYRRGELEAGRLERYILGSRTS